MRPTGRSRRTCQCTTRAPVHIVSTGMACMHREGVCKLLLCSLQADGIDNNGHGTHVMGTLLGSPIDISNITNLGYRSVRHVALSQCPLPCAQGNVSSRLHARPGSVQMAMSSTRLCRGLAPDARVAFVDLADSQGGGIFTPQDLASSYYPYTYGVRGCAAHPSSPAACHRPEVPSGTGAVHSASSRQPCITGLAIHTPCTSRLCLLTGGGADSQRLLGLRGAGL